MSARMQVFLVAFLCGCVIAAVFVLNDIYDAAQALGKSFATPVIVTTPDGKAWVAEHLYGNRFTVKHIRILGDPK